VADRNSSCGPTAATCTCERGRDLKERRDGAAARHIYIYTESDTFCCASSPDHQCLLKLASVIVHEAWHYRIGPSEDGADAEQIAFLILRGGSSPICEGVHRARRHVRLMVDRSAHVDR
jgi:hypothetical protein